MIGGAEARKEVFVPRWAPADPDPASATIRHRQVALRRTVHPAWHPTVHARTRCMNRGKLPTARVAVFFHLFAVITQQIGADAAHFVDVVTVFLKTIDQPGADFYPVFAGEVRLQHRLNGCAVQRTFRYLYRRRRETNWPSHEGRFFYTAGRTPRVWQMA